MKKSIKKQEKILDSEDPEKIITTPKAKAKANKSIKNKQNKNENDNDKDKDNNGDKQALDLEDSEKIITKPKINKPKINKSIKNKQNENNSDKQLLDLKEPEKIIKKPKVNKSVKNKQSGMEKELGVEKESGVEKELNTSEESDEKESESKIYPVIYHMADIHITNKNDRYEEYQEIFEKIYKLLEKDLRKKIIVICGDLYDNKITFKTSALKFVSKFIARLSKYGEVILINGNHDLSMVNESTESTIESMLTLSEELDKNLIKNIHYLNENRVYSIGGINFGLTKMFTKEVTKITDKKKNEIYIGLYHGKVYGAKTDLKYNVTNDDCDFKTTDFKDYDIVCLGDIHQHQYLDSKKK